SHPLDTMIRFRKRAAANAAAFLLATVFVFGNAKRLTWGGAAPRRAAAKTGNRKSNRAAPRPEEN
ncbi:MAG: hypothetical protein M5U33_02850, partial [Pseudorhodoplanes sp.]|nr:hypothetical protein [Pseudorhodoplanes sp.]